MKIDLAFHPIPGAVVSKTGDIDLANSTDTKLECIALPHAVDMISLESFAVWLGFCFYTNEKSMFLEDTMDRSPRTREVELVRDPSGTPCRIFLFKPDYSSFQ